MSAGEIAGLVAAIALAIGVVGFLLALGAMMRTMADMRGAVDEFRTSAIPLLSDVRSAVRQATAELGKVDVILDRAESISGTVDSASRLAHRAVFTPAVKAMALAAGVGGALKTLRKKG